ncbi:MAG: FKBP-type peptidyl-prolyl cis-trans isomerase [Candidatus Bathyarchaeia archaeon]
MAFQKGDFLVVDYVARVKETGEVFDTTSEEVAKKEKLYREGEVYESKLVVVGEGWVLKALDDSLPSLQLSKPETVEIPPDKAFGPRDPEKLKMIPLRRLRDKGITPQIGLRIDYEKKPATIRTVGAGRVTIDFNPPLAGKTLVYEVTAKAKLEALEEKMSALIHRRVPLVEVAKFKMELKGADVVIQVPEEAFYLEGIQLAKRGIATDVHRFFPEVLKVDFVETFKNPKAVAAEPPKKEEKPKPKRTRKAKSK